MKKRTPRRSTPFDRKYYAGTGAILLKPSTQTHEVVLEVHQCAVYLNANETMNVALSLSTAAKKIWGDEWVNDLVRYLEQL